MVNFVITAGFLLAYLFGIGIGWWLKSKQVKQQQLEQSE